MAPSARGTYRLTFGDGGEVSLVASAAGRLRERHWHVDFEPIIRSFGTLPSAALADLVDLAVCLYVADRVARRPRSDTDGGAHGWARHLAVEVPVREPDRWRGTTLSKAVDEALWLLTEDVWEITYTQRGGDDGAKAAPLFAHPLAHPGRAALFSGGLDSLAGLVRDLATRPADDIVVFSACSSDRVSAIQRGLIAAVQRRLVAGRELVHATADFGIIQHGHPYGDDEPSQRTRGFVFLALGAVAAVLAGARELAIYENGIGAINLPYVRTQLGAQSTRAAHPLALAAMGRVVTLAIEAPFTFRLPHLFQTKAELCRSLAEYGCADLVPHTVSCDHFPLRLKDTPQCGACSSCLLRRQALHAAGLGAFDCRSGYRYDVLDLTWSNQTDDGYALRAMLRQVADLRGRLVGADAWGALIREYPELAEVAVLADVADGPSVFPQLDLVALYRRYCAEWDLLPLPTAALAHAA